MNEVFLDTETTGLSVHDRHRIVEIACIETSDLLSTKRIFHKIINPQRNVPEEAFRVHGFSTEFLKDKETFESVADEFLEFKKDNIIDSLEVARNKFPGTSNSLDALCRRFNIDLSRRAKHNALLDCELLREVYINLLDAKEPKLIFSNDNLDRGLKNRNDIKKDYCKIVIKPTEEELKLHKEFLKKELKKNYY